jgi:5'-nucleotidase
VVTYAEAYAVTPFGNVVLSLDLTGDQIRQVLEQQYQPIPARGSRPMLALGVSEGFTYAWDATAAAGLAGRPRLDEAGRRGHRR